MWAIFLTCRSRVSVSRVLSRPRGARILLDRRLFPDNPFFRSVCFSENPCFLKSVFSRNLCFLGDSVFQKGLPFRRTVFWKCRFWKRPVFEKFPCRDFRPPEGGFGLILADLNVEFRGNWFHFSSVELDSGGKF